MDAVLEASGNQGLDSAKGLASTGDSVSIVVSASVAALGLIVALVSAGEVGAMVGLTATGRQDGHSVGTHGGTTLIGTRRGRLTLTIRTAVTITMTIHRPTTGALIITTRHHKHSGYPTLWRFALRFRYRSGTGQYCVRPHSIVTRWSGCSAADPILAAKAGMANETGKGRVALLSSLRWGWGFGLA